MRRLLLSSLLGAAVAFPSVALAQQTASTSVDEYLCTFAGKCGDEVQEEEPTTDAPETKGFSLARPGAAAEPTREAPKTKGFSLSRPAQKSAQAAPAKKPSAAPAKKSVAKAPAKKAPAAKATRTASASSKSKAAPTRAAATAEKRADLRVNFELGSATLTAQAMEEARTFAEAMKRPEMASMRFLIEGHTDAQGGREFNIDLSQRRAQAVADYLASLGVDRARLEVRGYGFDRPLPGRSAASQDNRRVEAVLVS